MLLDYQLNLLLLFQRNIEISGRSVQMKRETSFLRCFCAVQLFSVLSLLLFLSCSCAFMRRVSAVRKECISQADSLSVGQSVGARLPTQAEPCPDPQASLLLASPHPGAELVAWCCSQPTFGCT